MTTLAKWLLFLVSVGLGSALCYFLVTHIVTAQVTVADTHFFAPDTSHVETQNARVLDPSANWPLGIGLGVAVMLLWPVVGAIVASLWEVIHERAYDVKLEFESADEKRFLKLFLATFWPVTLAYSLIVYPSMAIISRLF